MVDSSQKAIKTTRDGLGLQQEVIIHGEFEAFAVDDEDTKVGDFEKIEFPKSPSLFAEGADEHLVGRDFGFVTILGLVEGRSPNIGSQFIFEMEVGVGEIKVTIKLLAIEISV